MQQEMIGYNPRYIYSYLERSFKTLEAMLSRRETTNDIDLSESFRILASLVQVNEERLKEGRKPEADAG